MRIRKALLHLEILAGLLWALPMAAAELSDADLRSGLTQLASLLAADVPKDARWVLAESQGRRFGIFTQEEDVFRTEGNTFLFNEKPGVEARVLFLSTGTFYTVKAERQGDGGGQGQERRVQEFRATWKNADVAKDMEAAAEWLKKEAKQSGGKSAPASADPFGSMPDENGSPDQLAMHQQTALLWAAVLQRTGHDAESLKLARAALSGADEKRRKLLLDGCFDRRGSQGLAQAMEDFASQHDWSRLAESLTALLKQYPLGWKQRDAVCVLHRKVADRAKLPAVPPLKTTRPLAEEDQKTLLAWLQNLEAGNSLDDSRWTLPLPATNEEAEDDTPVPQQQNSQAVFPRSHGLAAIPLLAALLADETLTLVGTNQGRHYYGGYSRSVFGGEEEEPVTRLQQAYNALPKPQTRAQLAWNLLQRVLPGDLQRSSDDNLADKASEVLNWYASVKDATPADLALAYFEAGDSGADIIALAMTTNDPKKFARLENQLISQAQIYDISPMIPFVEKLGPEKGPAFVAKVRRKLEVDLTRYDTSDMSRQRKQMETHLKRLETAAKGEKKDPDLKEILKLLAAHDDAGEDEDAMELREAYNDLPKLLRKLPAAERLNVILGALPDFKSSTLALNMLNYALHGDRRQDTKDLKPAERAALLERTRPHWQKLLDAPSDDAEPEQENAAVMQIAASLEQLASGSASNDVLYSLSMLGDRGAAILRQRASALLAGQKVEPLPDAQAVAAADGRKLLAEWSQKTADEIARGLDTLRLEQLLALNEVLSRTPDLPGHFKEYSGLIHTVQITGVKDAAPWEAFKGRAWSKDTLLALAAQVSNHSGGRLLVKLQRGNPLFGFKLRVSEVAKFTSDWQVRSMANEFENASEELGPEFPKLGKRISAGSLQGEGTNPEWAWLDAPRTDEAREGAAPAGTVEGDAAEALQQMHEAELEAWKALSAASREGSARRFRVVFISAPVADLAKKEKD